MESSRCKYVSGPFFPSMLSYAVMLNIMVSPDVYSQAFPKDRLALKTLIYIIYLLEMAQTILLVDRAWETLVKEYGNLEILDEVGTSNISICFIGGLGVLSMFLH